MELGDCIFKLRKRIRDLRIADADNVSIHIISAEIALNLVDLSLNTSPHRPIENCEKKWFDAGRYIEIILVNSEWEDIIMYYYRMVELVEKNNYFNV